MTTLTYPSSTFPGRPSVELDLPDGWQSVPAAAASPGVAIAAVRPLPEDEFKANVVVSLDDTAADHTVQTDLDAVATTAGERSDGAVGESYERQISGITFFGRDLSYVDDIAGTLLVTNQFGFLRRGVDRTLVRITVTGSVGGANYKDDYAHVQTMIAALRVTPATGTEPLSAEA